MTVLLDQCTADYHSSIILPSHDYTPLKAPTFGLLRSRERGVHDMKEYAAQLNAVVKTGDPQRLREFVRRWESVFSDEDWGIIALAGESDERLRTVIAAIRSDRAGQPSPTWSKEDEIGRTARSLMVPYRLLTSLLEEMR